MPHTLRARLRFNLVPIFLTAGYLSFLMAGCASTPTPAATIHKDARSAVYLQNVPDRSFRAAHPLKVDQSTVENVLRGVRVEKKADFTLLLGKALKNYVPEDARAFYEDDIDVLTPHITAALAQAAPNQRVLFQLRYYATGLLTSPQKKGAPSMETTEGYLFADGLSLHLTLTEFAPGKAYITETHVEPRIVPDPIGLYDREVKFTPEAAMRDKSSWFGSDDHTVAIDYQLATKLLAAPPQPVPTATPAAAQPGQPAPPSSAQAAKNDAELRAFKEELKAMQKKLDEQNAELQELKKASPKKK